MEVLSYEPIGLEGLDYEFIEDMKIKGLHPRDVELMPEGGGWLLVEFGGHTQEESRDKAHRLIDDLKRQPNPPRIKLFEDKAQERLVWELREAGLGATAHWFKKRPPINEGKPEVMLWADTFSTYFQPEIAKAAVEVLEDADWRVTVASEPLCCGRPLYDYGMLDTARALLLRDIRSLRPQIERDTPIVVLEPSCASVFRDEMTDLIWGDEDAMRLRGQVFLLSEFLADKAGRYNPPRMKRHALTHIHCHHQSILGTAAERRLLDEMGLSVEIPATGCCGMAGAFGYEKGDHYDVSIACGERVLLPSVHQAASDTVIIADGFSCREQIEQTTTRRALHLAQALRMALDVERGRSAPAHYPERAFPARLSMTKRQKILTGARWAAVAGATAALWWGLRRNHA